MFWLIFLFATSIKLLLIKSYRSTDFEVHRNWLAITHSLPPSKWYYENTSEWTLDYPPFFAFFEWTLSQMAQFFDPKMLQVNHLNYDSDATILFQRLSVITTDIVFALGVKKCISALKIKNSLGILAASLIFLCNIGLIFVDHIHFQYNGFLFGILLLSIGYLLEERFLVSCVLFASLLNFKHIFIYMAPAFGAFYLKFHCYQGKQPISNFFGLLAAGLSCFVLSFGLFYQHLPQVFSRLFPFKRGLTHAYWAPNFWALYNFADKVAEVALKIPKQGGSNTGGLVKEYVHVFLPKISPMTTFLLTGLVMVPCVIKLLFFTDKRNSMRAFLQAVVICSCTSFMFGWHVHEKAILMAIIPFSLLSLLDTKDARYSFLLSFVGNFSLFPLLFTPELAIVKYSLFLAYTSAHYVLLKLLHQKMNFHWYEIVYLCGFIMLPMFEHIISPILNLNTKLPFLPLLLTSIYCSVGILYTFLSYYILYMSDIGLAYANANKSKMKLKSK
ncbi:probable dolichyl pyrophosphate Glc1Man9GlcNAc2 alpha-1,3-glucosyltransferase [Episyrphus balteatus]|uniref:probable dolichyl pyrophosphate Glc1Man9GlcNAc2 alpha-1,3-glucosyltransferase n=1 Tax=Episyrphus balteatus TaxID=286459 RepID=UPI002484E973|nr:probable dolichyl pyrophosphate Glc1Man9GlcNAc2 alpha-1,3-glucosyltransferase [Episyrphus balteatus]